MASHSFGKAVTNHLLSVLKEWFSKNKTVVSDVNYEDVMENTSDYSRGMRMLTDQIVSRISLRLYGFFLMTD